MEIKLVDSGLQKIIGELVNAQKAFDSHCGYRGYYLLVTATSALIKESARIENREKLLREQFKQPETERG